MEKNYDPQRIESQWIESWQKSIAQDRDQNLNAKPYCIMLPPPNVTGRLHMGHAFQVSLMDALVRYHTMMGYDTHWQVGTDHAGIATQMVVERQLAEKNISKNDLGREKFLQEAHAWKEQSGSIIEDQINQMGALCDWNKSCFTMDSNFHDAVCQLFVKLYDDGLIYKGTKLVNWDPHLETAISDLEVINKEQNTNLWHIRYGFEDPSDDIHGLGYIIVATTRPETLFGDAAVCVHPDDQRYQHLIGKSLIIPLTNKSIPIITDEYVDPEFGTGCLKITPAHDFNDHEIGKKHKLALMNIFDKKAKLNKNVPEKYQGLERSEARKQVIIDLKAQQLIEKITPHKANIPYGDRSGKVIEPYLTPQWYVKCDRLARDALKVVESGEIKFYPEGYINTYRRWLEDIQDWCVSRQLWWGHRIPAWYDQEGKVYVGMNEEDIKKKYKLDKKTVLSQDEDVLDTWFSSALWPFATLGWPNETLDLQKFFPQQVLITGHDIIFYWVARMIMMSLYTTGQVPFKAVCFTGLIRDENNEKMSKSKGNIIDPLDLIHGITLDELLKKRTFGLMQPEKKQAIIEHTKKQFPNGMRSHGTDALRFTFYASATTGRDIRFEVKKLEGYGHFCNKLWNATRFVLGQKPEGFILDIDTFNIQNLSLPDAWILTELEKMKVKIHRYFENYRFDLSAQVMYEFIWHELCDWYIEMCKPTLNGEDQKQRKETYQVLMRVLQETIIILHPFMPYITSTLWQEINLKVDHKNPNQKNLIEQAYPSNKPLFLHQEHDAIESLKAVVSQIRNMRSEMHINPGLQIPLMLTYEHEQEKQDLAPTILHLKTLAKINTVTWYRHDQSIHEPCAFSQCNGIGIHIPLEGLINKNDEQKRVEKQLMKNQKELDQIEKKLANTKFREKAPKTMIEDARKARHELQEKIKRYQKHLETLAIMK